MNIVFKKKEDHFIFLKNGTLIQGSKKKPLTALNIGKGDEWLEILVCGMINPRVLENCGIDSKKYQGFEFGIDKKSKNEDFLIPENILKEFRVVELINAYRTRGHLFTKTNPVRERRKYVRTLDSFLSLTLVGPRLLIM